MLGIKHMKGICYTTKVYPNLLNISIMSQSDRQQVPYTWPTQFQSLTPYMFPWTQQD